MERRLHERGYLADAVEMAVYKLEKEALLDDGAFARAWARARAARQLGRARILQELRQKGVDSHIAEAAVAELNEDDEADAATALASKLLKRHQRETAGDAMRKAIAAMQRRGYNYGEAKRALEAALEQLREEEEND